MDLHCFQNRNISRLNTSVDNRIVNVFSLSKFDTINKLEVRNKYNILWPFKGDNDRIFSLLV